MKQKMNRKNGTKKQSGAFRQGWAGLLAALLVFMLAAGSVLAEQNGPAAAADAAEETDIQYVLYLGTNGKDTNKPVFTQSEAFEQLKAILLRHFGGYTIQEAHGGWISDGTEYQEYTLVIYLSDTTIDKVHAAADEMIEVFDQSSILIQANRTKTEFYSPVRE